MSSDYDPVESIAQSLRTIADAQEKIAGVLEAWQRTWPLCAARDATTPAGPDDTYRPGWRQCTLRAGHDDDHESEKGPFR